MFTSMAAVPASTSCSPQFRATMYSPNHSTPEVMIPGQAPRRGSPSRRTSRITPSTRAPVASRPRASAPGEYASPALRMETKAEAHSTTVVQAAATARALGGR